MEGYQKPRFNFGIWAPDGGILLDGVISGDNGLDSYSQCFFMKLDSLGCRQPGCAQTVFTSTDDLSKHNDVFDGDLRFSPNPAADFVQIEQPEKAVSARAELRFSNVLGETIFQTPFSNPKTTVRTADWPAGIYLVQLFEHGALKKAARLIVVH